MAIVAAVVVAAGLLTYIGSPKQSVFAKWFSLRNVRHFASLHVSKADTTKTNGVPKGFQLTKVSTLGSVSPAYTSVHKSLASPNGQWLALYKPGTGTFLENMSGQEIKVSDRKLRIAASTPTSAVVMKDLNGSVVLAYLPTQGPRTSQKSNQSAARQAVSQGNVSQSESNRNTATAQVDKNVQAGRVTLRAGQVRYFPIGPNSSGVTSKHLQKSAVTYGSTHHHLPQTTSIKPDGNSGASSHINSKVNSKKYAANQNESDVPMTVWAKESTGGNWIEKIWSKSRASVRINRQVVPRLAKAVAAEWSPTNGDVLAAVLPDTNSVDSGKVPQNYTIVTYNVLTKKLHTVVQGVSLNVSGGARHVLQWSRDGFEVSVVTTRGLAAFSTTGRAAKGWGSFPELRGPYVWLNQYYVLAADYKHMSTSGPANVPASSETATKLSVAAWFGVNASSISAGPSVSGRIIDIRRAGAGRALVQTTAGLWLVNQGKDMQLLHRDATSWWYDAKDNSLYVMVTGSAHVYRKSLTGLLTGGGSQ
ncbi:hypothetical protein GI364_22915 [Alicyclobacillus sp. SO9]|nr:hypothetical protein GI364_22915 [Alicyclobacillus sp. SO9]